MNPLLTAGALALATISLVGVAGCDRRPQERVIERETTVVHDEPVIVHEDGDRHQGDRREEVQGGDRRDYPPPQVHPDARPADAPADRQDYRH